MIGLLGSILGGRGGRMIGGMIGGSKGRMIGSLAGAMLGGKQLGRLGSMLKGAVGGDGGNDATAPIQAPGLQESDAEILVAAMCNAAKADGVMDDTEKAQIISELGEITADERLFMERQISAPFVSAADMARQVPAELRAEAYAVSLIAINVDTAEEASYLRELASALGLSDGDRNDIHDDLGADLL